MKQQTESKHKHDSRFWNERYLNAQTGWDTGCVTEPMKEYIDQLEIRETAILIPGCGNSYEAEYLLEKGFKNLTLIDISDVLVENLKEKFSEFNGIRVICSDFFDHEGKYDLILEQTFFCALHPSLREDYSEKVFDLLNPNGKLAGVLFDKDFGNDGPPYGGNRDEYRRLFQDKFEFRTFEVCRNSIEPRRGSEIFINLRKKFK